MFSLNIVFACLDAENLDAANSGAAIHARSYDTAVFWLAKYFDFSERCSQIRRVGCELEFKLLLAADTNHGSVFPNYNRPGERPYDP